VLLTHGGQDKFVPFSHGGDGYVTLLEHRIPEVHAWLADRL
jgi:fermentation-respiration switch protein FrsA (DUF1100 family)